MSGGSDFDPARWPGLADAVAQAVRARGGKGSREIAFRCPYPDNHQHGDRKPSASYNRAENVWICQGCGASGGLLDLARLLGIEPDAFDNRRNGTPLSRPITASPAPPPSPSWPASTEPPAGGLAHPKLGRPAVAWPARDGKGRLFGIHARWNTPEGKTLRWWRDGEWTLGSRTLAEAPLYRSELLAVTDPEAVVVVAEGEKAADALAGLGLASLGTFGSAAIPGREALDVLRGRRVVLFPDADAPGREHMARLAEALRGVAVEVRLFSPAGLPDKGDACEWIAARPETWGDAELLAQLNAEAVPVEITATAPPRPDRKGTAWMLAGISPLSELLAQAIPEPEPLIEGLLYEGAAILSGPPKTGKSALARCVAYAVTTGRSLIGGDVPRPGAVLYLSLEDGKRRTRKRFADLLRGEPAPPGLSLATEWGRQDEGGLDAIEEWITTTPGSRLVILDTLAAFRPRPKGSARTFDRYTFDYDALAAVQALATRHHVSLLVIHHNRKAVADDPMELVSGTAGVTGAVDAVLVLRRPRAEDVAELTVMSRDAEERKVAVVYDGASGWWNLSPDGRAALLTPQRRQILDCLRDLKGETAWPREVAEITSLPTGSVKHLLAKMAEAGDIERTAKGYRVLGTTARL